MNIKTKLQHDATLVKFENHSVSGIDRMYGKFRLKIPGHCIGEKAVTLPVPGNLLEDVTAYLRRNHPAITLSLIKAEVTSGDEQVDSGEDTEKTFSTEGTDTSENANLATGEADNQDAAITTEFESASDSVDDGSTSSTEGTETSETSGNISDDSSVDANVDGTAQTATASTSAETAPAAVVPKAAPQGSKAGKKNQRGGSKK